MGYIPDSDDQFETWQTQYTAYVNANLAGPGLSAIPLDADVAAMNTAQTDWTTKYTTHVSAHAKDTSQRLRNTTGFASEGTPTGRANPAGVAGCEIWLKLGGPPPTHLSECHFLVTDGRTPCTAHFIGRWMSTRNEPRPLSETASTTVPG